MNLVNKIWVIKKFRLIIIFYLIFIFPQKLFCTTIIGSNSGSEAFIKGDYKVALLEWEKIASRDEDAQMKLGMLYISGLLGSKDFIKAKYWFSEAAYNGNVYAKYNLGKLHEQLGSEEDIKEAISWYRIAAESGNTFSQLKLSQFYIKGIGVEKNINIGHMWLNLSASSGPSHQSSLRTKSI